MMEAGIEDANSQKGIDFCTEKCPHPTRCILFETKRGMGEIAEHRATVARELHNAGYSLEEIAATLGVTTRSVYGYLSS